MTPEEITDFVIALGGTIVVVASEENGDPEMAWGDTFFFYDPDGITVPERRLPFATIITSDYPGFDETSNLDRDDVFRVNMSVGKETADEYAPPDGSEVDPSVLDVVMPHPIYGKQGWLCVLNPSSNTDEAVKDLLIEAHRRAQDRYQKRS